MKGGGGPAVLPPVLVSEAPVLYESAHCSAGTVMKGFVQTRTDGGTSNITI